MLKKQLSRLNGLLTWPFLALLFLLLFKIPFENLLNLSVVDPLIKHVQSNQINDIVFIVLIIWFLIWHTARIGKSHTLSADFILFTGLVCAIYSWYRFIDTQVWAFRCFYFLKGIKYLDVLYLAFSIPILGLITTKLIHKKRLEESNDFIEDNPLNEFSEDLLNQEHYAKDLAIKLNRNTFKRSYALGITGAWGTGKTSFMNLIRRNLDKQSKIIFDFNPWSSHSQNSITPDFFRAMQSALSEYDYSIDAVITDYAHSLVDSYGNPFFKSIFPLKGKKSLAQQYQKINDLLIRIDKQIIVFIDDLDRLDENELLEVMKLIRNTANFYNVVFIVAYDRNYLINAIRKINSHNSEFFLEKIFQMEISLPSFEKKLLRDYLFKMLTERIDSSWHKELKELIYGTGFTSRENSILTDYIVTVRDIVRFTNSFLMNFKKLEGEVLISELLHLELLRFKFPSVYELLAQKKHTFLETTQESLKIHAYKFKLSKDRESVFLKHIESNHSNLSIALSHLMQIKNLLEEVFPSNYTFGRHKHPLSVRYPSNFDKYFAVRLLEGNISEVEFSKNRNSEQEIFNKFIQDTVTQGLSWELKNKFEQINSFDSRDDFEKVITGIFTLTRCPETGWINDLSDDLANKLYNDSQIAKNFYDGSVEELRKFILTFFQAASYPYIMEGELVNGWRGRLFDDTNKVFKSYDLETLILDYFQKVTLYEPELNETVWQSFRNCWVKGFTKDEGSSSYTSGEYYIPGTSQLFISFIKEKGLEKFLTTIISPNRRTENQFSIWNMTEIFGSWDDFESFLEEFSDDGRDFLIEFKHFYRLYEAVGFNQSIEFQFQYLRIKEPK